MVIMLYMFVMVLLMIIGGKIGEILGCKCVFVIGCVVYVCGLLMMVLVLNLMVFLIGWLGLEGLGVVLIMFVIVVLVVLNFGKFECLRVYGFVVAVGAIVVVLGLLIGGVFMIYVLWRWVFVGEVVIVVVILFFGCCVNDRLFVKGVKLDLFGIFLLVLGLVLIVFVIFKFGIWGVV